LALYDHHPTEKGKLVFNKGDAIMVTNLIDRFTASGRVQGNEFEGQFPTTYALKQDESDEGADVRASELNKAWDPKASPTHPIVKGKGKGVNRKHRMSNIKFRDNIEDHCETYSKMEYDRCGEFDPHKASAEWEHEEEEEKIRQQRVLWEHMEKDLPPGEKCEDRRKIEIELQNKALEAAKEKERRRAEFAEKRRKQKAGLIPTREDKLNALRVARTKRGDTISVRSAQPQTSAEDLNKRMLEQITPDDAEC